AQRAVAQVAVVLAGPADVVDVAARALVRPNHGVVAVDAGRHARPRAPGLVAAVDERLAPRQRVVHRLALTLAEDGRVAALAASHGPVVRVLRQSVRQAVADEDTLQVDVAVLVREDL